MKPVTDSDKETRDTKDEGPCDTEPVVTTKRYRPRESSELNRPHPP